MRQGHADPDSKVPEEELRILQEDAHIANEQSAHAIAAVRRQANASHRPSPGVIQAAYKCRADAESRQAARHSQQEPKEHKDDHACTVQR